jgi:hypothetical protein
VFQHKMAQENGPNHVQRGRIERGVANHEKQMISAHDNKVMMIEKFASTLARSKRELEKLSRGAPPVYNRATSKVQDLIVMSTFASKRFTVHLSSDLRMMVVYDASAAPPKVANQKLNF